jgi:hypothetical protein
MKLLILGGTKFLGRYVVEAALSRGHEVTLFNRGQLNPELFPDVEKLRGDRDGGLEALKGRRWDAVVDPSGYSPRVVRDAARLLADAVEHYAFISSQSVYKDTSVPGVDEDYPVGTITDEQLREAEALKQSELTAAPFFWEIYGPLKALCERAAEGEMPGRVKSHSSVSRTVSESGRNLRPAAMAFSTLKPMKWRFVSSDESSQSGTSIHCWSPASSRNFSSTQTKLASLPDVPLHTSRTCPIVSL